MREPIFLTLVEIIEIHKNQIKLYGGDSGMRDIGLLQSAIAQPEASFAGEWLHENIFLMAAAYAFHICKNHAFVDGNKRTALVSALVLLELNEIGLDDPNQKLLKAMLEMASGNLNKSGFSKLLQSLKLEV